MISSFGAEADILAEYLPDGLQAIVVDETATALAYREAVARRERGERFYLLVLTSDRRVKACNTIANLVAKQFSNGDDRYTLAEQLAAGTMKISGHAVSGNWTSDHPSAAAVAELAPFADELLVRSYAEYERLLGMGCLPKMFRRFLSTPTAPAIEARPVTSPSVVVWQGSRPASDMTLALIGLEQFRGSVAYIGDERLPLVRGEFISRHSPEAREALERAGCIICVDPGNPSDAVTFARCGKSVVAPRTSGAYEYAHGIVAWDAASAPELARCIAIAQGRETPADSPDDLPLVPRGPVLPAAVEDVPLVTIITPTYSRREYLRSMLGCIAAQTYPRIECVVVNDGGEAVEDIVALFPFARLVNAESNGGALNACKLGLDAALGEYIGLLPDDDWLYPDHVERIMAGILRSGAAWGHSCSVLRFQRHAADGALETYGFNGRCFTHTVTPTGALVGTPVAGHQCLQRRDTFDPADVGWYLDIVGTDQEYHMRLLERYTPVMIDTQTCEFRDHPSNQGRAFNWFEAMREVYEDIHPLNGRPHIVAERQKTLQTLRGVPLGENCNRPSITF